MPLVVNAITAPPIESGAPCVDTQDIVQAGVAAQDGCPVLTRIKAFLVQEGVVATLEHTFRDRQGRSIDLNCDVDVMPIASTSSLSLSESESESESPVADQVILKILEAVGPIGVGVNVVQTAVLGSVSDSNNGVVRAVLPSEVAKRAGIYQLSWGYKQAGTLKMVNHGLLSVERSLFGFETSPAEISLGPPTINELRMQIMDSAAAENLLLQDVEFDDEQILMALLKPLMEFDESPPPLTLRFTTLNFPWRNHWLDASVGYLYQFAAANYRRNRLSTNAGGVTVDDKNKEREYMVASQLMLQKWRQFFLAKKIQLNAADCVGTLGSTYGSYLR